MEDKLGRQKKKHDLNRITQNEEPLKPPSSEQQFGIDSNYHADEEKAQGELQAV